MIPKAYPFPRSARSGAITQLGVDVGATLTKLAIRHRSGDLELRRIPTEAGGQVASEIGSIGAERVGVTGGGAASLIERLALAGRPANEFEAWAAGARALLRRHGRAAPERFLLVSVGTGTSAILVDGTRVRRAGGTALGGGTLVGLGTVLAGTSDFDSLARMAREGDRRRVDLLVEDIYPSGDLPLPGGLNAASFARLARSPTTQTWDRRDLAHAITGLVGENVALICGGLASAMGVAHILYGGGTLRDNPSLTDILRAVAPANACEATILSDGEFAGALGAMELVATAGP